MNARAYTGAGSVSNCPSSSAWMYLVEMRVSRSTSVSVSPRAVLACVSAFPSSCVDMQGSHADYIQRCRCRQATWSLDGDRKCYVDGDMRVGIEKSCRARRGYAAR